MAAKRYKRSTYLSFSAVVAMAAMVIFYFVFISLSAVRLLSGIESPPHSIHVDERVTTNPTNTTPKDKEDGPDRWVEAISWEPRAFIYHNFLTKEECEHLIAAAKPHMTRSTVVDHATGKGKDSKVRTSSGTFLARGRDSVVQTIEKRIADFTFIPVEHGEGLQVLHYEVGQYYGPHPDFFTDAFNTKNGGQRIATFLMYLSDVEEGGETVFPAVTRNVSAVPSLSDELSECGRKGLAVKPKMGNALLFWSLRPDGSPDPYSFHSGCPVIRGNKWSSTKWLRVHEYRY